MCDCPKDKINELVSSRRDDTAAGETSPQNETGGAAAATAAVDRRPKQGCCRRVLTYEDEVTVTELPVSITTPQTPGPEYRGVAIVRRRIDYTSPDRKDEASKKADEGTTSEDKPKDSEKKGEEGESPAEANADQTTTQPTTETVVASTPCPGQLNPNNDCNCSAIPKT